jgi:threonine dehydratase
VLWPASRTGYASLKSQSNAEFAPHWRVCSASTQAVPVCNLRLIPPSAPIDHAEVASLIRDAHPPTPLEPAPALRRNATVLLKREDLGPNGAFKWRGALAAVADLRAGGATEVVTASSGNHGAATAWAARRLGLIAHVVVPSEATGIKCELIEANGATLHRFGAGVEEAGAHARELAQSLGAPYLEDGGSPAQLAGAATIADELEGAEAEAVIAPVGVGALAGGLGIGFASLERPRRLIGVQVSGYDRIARALAGRPWPADAERATFADGLADTRLVEPAYGACREHLERLLVVDDTALRAAVRELNEATGLVVEGAGAAALAGLRVLEAEGAEPATAVLIVSGRNLDPAVAREILTSTGA